MFQIRTAAAGIKVKLTEECERGLSLHAAEDNAHNWLKTTALMNWK